MSGAWIVAYMILLTVVVLMGILLVGTLRRISPLLEQAEAKLRLMPSELAPAGLPPGTAVPHFESQGLDGSAFGASDLRGTPSVVLFVDADCEPCRGLVAELKRYGVDDVDTRVVAVVDNPSDGASLRAIPGVTVIRQAEREVARVFQSSVTPQAFVVDATGVVVESGNPNSLEDLRELVRRHERGERRGKDEARIAPVTR